MIQMTEEEFIQHRDDCNGICLHCKEVVYGGVEPDAERYRCEICEQDEVYGIEQLMLMGYIEITD